MCIGSSLVSWCGYPQSKSAWRESGGKGAGRTQKCQAGGVQVESSQGSSRQLVLTLLSPHRLELETLEMSLCLAQPCSLADWQPEVAECVGRALAQYAKGPGSSQQYHKTSPQRHKVNQITAVHIHGTFQWVYIPP